MTVRILRGDCLVALSMLPAESAHTCVTSPPYFGLRDYGTAKWEGGDVTCDHRHYLGGHGPASAKQVTSAGTQKYNYVGQCKKCGAMRVDEQIGLEETPEQYVAKMVEVFREVRRVLRDDGTLWLNLGDSYARPPGKGQHKPGDAGKQNYIIERGNGRAASMCVPEGTKPKDLLGIPWMVAFALRADGWYLRQDIIWHKPNPMPESVRDRCTKAHEYIFMLAKRERYYYDSAAVAEDVAAATIERISQANLANRKGSETPSKGNGPMKAVIKKQDGHGRRHAGFNDRYFEQTEAPPKRNRRSVWTVTTKPFKGAHFATFPPDLIEPCILAGAPVGGMVLDPFGGAGTTGMVAQRRGRSAILCELNPEYAAMAEARIAEDRRKQLEALL